jgi:lipopolysaccharide export system protein LptA
MYKNKSIVEKNIQENLSTLSDDVSENSTSFENLEYKGLYDLDKTFIVKSQKAHINDDEPDVVYMTNMHVILYLKDGRIVNILSDAGTYNKANYDCFFEQNVRASDGDTKIFSENLELLGDKSIVKIYNNVVVNYPTGSFLQADNVDYNFETKYFKVSMFDDQRIKMKVLNE